MTSRRKYILKKWACEINNNSIVICWNIASLKFELPIGNGIRDRELISNEISTLTLHLGSGRQVYASSSLIPMPKIAGGENWGENWRMENGIKPRLPSNVGRGSGNPSESIAAESRGNGDNRTTADITLHATGEGACSDYRASDQLHRQSLPTHYRTRPRDEASYPILLAITCTTQIFRQRATSIRFSSLREFEEVEKFIPLNLKEFFFQTEESWRMMVDSSMERFLGGSFYHRLIWWSVSNARWKRLEDRWQRIFGRGLNWIIHATVCSS